MSDDLPAWILATFGSGGVGVLVLRAIRDWSSGRAATEKEQNQRDLDSVNEYRSQLAKDAKENDERADREARARRLLEEYAGVLRRLLTDQGIDPPSWPKY